MDKPIDRVRYAFYWRRDNGKWLGRNNYATVEQARDALQYAVLANHTREGHTFEYRVEKHEIRATIIEHVKEDLR